METKDIIDLHCHTAGIGAGDSGCFVSPALMRSWKYRIYLGAFGVTEKDLAGIDGGDLARLVAKMRAAGHIEVWRYAVRKADSGDLQQAPASRAIIIYADTLRVEPYVSPLKVLPPG